MEGIKRIHILGCPFDSISFAKTVEYVRIAVLRNRRLQVVPGSIDSVMKARRDSRFCQELNEADLVVADGVPIVWAASLLCDPLKGRVSGTDLIWSCAEISAETGGSIALIGAKPGVADRAARKMMQRFPRANLHAIATPFSLGQNENRLLVHQIKAVGARIVLAALGAPRQERWISTYLEDCHASVGIGCGSAFDIISGDQPRAPRWMCDHGLEWMHRLFLDPRRLGRRYLIEDSPFLLLMAMELMHRRFLNGMSR
ncbi:MAG TPA: WecB/TagA/CpsF family glycosyltransferase [Terriglobia bacterium]|nr:WecB/TagA/CpsF family glycosyltransferase [Terriglobia bacterium]